MALSIFKSNVNIQLFLLSTMSFSVCHRSSGPISPFRQGGKLYIPLSISLPTLILPSIHPFCHLPLCHPPPQFHHPSQSRQWPISPFHQDSKLDMLLLISLPPHSTICHVIPPSITGQFLHTTKVLSSTYEPIQSNIWT